MTQQTITQVEELSVDALRTRDVDPDKVQVAMVLRETGAVIKDWISYEFNQHFLTPTSGFSFIVGGFHFLRLFEAGVRPGARVSLRLGENFVGDGYIDDVEIGADRSGGIVAHITGRDRVGYAIDSNAKPTIKFKEGATLADALKEILAPYGFTKFELSNDANVGLQTGLVSGQKFSAGGKKKGPKPLSSFVLHETKPYPGEGAFEFAQRLTQRHGLWLWLAADGETVVVSKPDYTRAPAHSFFRYLNGRSNVLSGTVKYGVGEQPTLIIAEGIGGGGEWGHSQLQAKCTNPVCWTDDPAWAQTWLEYKNAQTVEFGPVGQYPFIVPKCRTVYLHDQSSQTPQQLANFVKREMSLAVRKSLQGTYSVIGHGQMVNDQFVPYAVDTMIEVEDEVTGVREPLWVVSRTFARDRENGTTTRLELLRAHSLELGEAITPPKGGGGDSAQHFGSYDEFLAYYHRAAREQLREERGPRPQQEIDLSRAHQRDTKTFERENPANFSNKPRDPKSFTRGNKS